MADTNPFTSDQSAEPATNPAPVAAAPRAGGGYGSIDPAAASASASAGSTGGSVSAGGAEGGAYARPDPEVDGPGANYTAPAGAGGDFKAGGATSGSTGGPVASPADWKMVNALFLILVFLSWVGCWVVFTGHLNSLYTGEYNVPSSTCQMFWNRMECVSSDNNQPSFTLSYGSCDNAAPTTPDFRTVCDACHRSGQGTLALAVFGFLCLTPLLVLLILRVIGKPSGVPLCGADPERYQRAETALTAGALFFFWVLMMLWRTKCMEAAQSWNFSKGAVVVGSGWWYTVGTFFFLIVALVCSLAYTENPCCRHRCRDTLAEQPNVSAAARAGPDPSCGTGFANSPAFATRCDSVLNVFVAVCLALCWIGAVVTMAGELHRVTLNVSPGGTVVFHWDKIEKAGEGTVSYSDCFFTTSGGSQVAIITQDQCDSCQTGGRGTVATGALAFIVATAQLIFVLLRFSGKVKSTLLRFEHYLSVAICVCLMFSSVVWGGTCFNSVKQGLPSGIDHSMIGTGWGYVVFCFILSIVNVLNLWIIRHRAADLPALDQGGVYANLRSEV